MTVGHREQGGTSNTEDGTSDAAEWQLDEVTVFDIAAFSLRHRWLVVGSVILVAVTAVVTGVMRPLGWTTSARFTPQAGTSQGGSRLATIAGEFGIDIGGGQGTSQSLQFYAQLIRSREILGEVAADRFEVGDTLAVDGRGVIRGTLAEILEIEADQASVRRAAAIGWLNGALNESIDPASNIIEVSITTPWPDLSEQIGDHLLDRVNEFNLQTRQSQAAEEREFVEKRMELAREELRASENALERFLQNNRRFQNSPELVFEHDRLQRSVTMRQQLYTSLAQSYEQARVEEVRNTPVITVIESPMRPIAPNSRRLRLRFVLGAIFGTVFGILLGVARDIVTREKRESQEAYEEFALRWNETKSELKRGWQHLTMAIGRSGS